jgi:hypothetical protein
VKHTHPLIHLAALASASVLSTTLLGATAAQAAIVVTAATRSVSAETQGAAPGAATSNSTSAEFSEVKTAQVFLDTGDGPFTRAFQESTGQSTTVIDVGGGVLAAVPSFGGDIATSSQGLNGRSGLARSSAEYFFTLTGDFKLQATVRYTTRDLANNTDLSFVLERLDGGGAVIGSGSDDDIAGDTLDEVASFFNVPLAAGEYRFSYAAQTRGSGSDSDDSSFGNLRFRAFFIDQGDAVDPPGAVPEPASLALTLAGLCVGGALRRRAALPRRAVST